MYGVDRFPALRYTVKFGNFRKLPHYNISPKYYFFKSGRVIEGAISANLR